jgi:hypothetical protein
MHLCEENVVCFSENKCVFLWTIQFVYLCLSEKIINTLCISAKRTLFLSAEMDIVCLTEKKICVFL